MADSPQTSGFGINVGDAVLTFLGDTTDLERAWTEMEENSTSSVTRTINEVMKQYDRLGIDGSAKLNDAAEQAKEAFSKLSASGVASMSDLIQAEQEVIERQIALKTSLGESIPIAVVERLESLKLQYIGITGTVEEFEYAQTRSALAIEKASQDADQNAIALKRQQEAINADVAAYEREVAVLNEVSAANAKAAASRTGVGGDKAAGAGAEEGALAGGIGALTATATSLALYAGVAAVAGSLAEGVKQALAFDAAFTELTTVIQEKTPQSAEVIEMLRNQLMALPPTLGSITDLTHGVYQALSAGVPAAEAVKVVAQSATFAKAALTDMETSVKLVTASMNAYGLTAQDVDHITGALMATIQVGVLRGPQLAESLGRVLPVAANLKVSLSDVLGAASALTAGGLSADESMTALRQVLSTIEKPSSEAKKAMNDLHMSFADVRAEIAEKGLGAGLATLGDKIKDNTTLTTELFGNIRALTGILGLTGPQAEKYASYTADITQAYKDANLAQIEFNKVNQSLDGQLHTISNTISNDFVAGFQKAQPIVQSLIPSLKAIIVESGLLKAGIFALLAVLLTLAVSLTTVGIVVEGVKDAFFRFALAAEEGRAAFRNFVGLSDDSTAKIANLKDQIAKNTDALNTNRQAMKDSLQAFDGIIKGTSSATDKSKAFEAAQIKLAEAQDRATTAHKKMSDQLSADARIHQDAIDKAEAEAQAREKLQKAIDKTTKAMESYASSHGVPLASELEKNVTAAQKFYDLMVRTDQPIASQTAAIISLNIAMGKLRATLDDKRGIGEMLSDIGKGPNFRGIEEIPAQVTALVTDPLVDAFNLVLEAEQRLGIVGTATLSKYLHDTETDVQMVRDAFKAGAATADELVAAEKRLQDAQENLNKSFTTDRMKQFQAALDAEKAAGVQGTATLKELRDKAEDAYVALKKVADANKGTGGGAESANALQQAQLKALEADIKLKASLGQPIPQTEIQQYRTLKTAIDAMDDSYKKATSSQASFMDGLKSHVPEVTGAANLMKSEGAAAFDDFANSFGSAVQQVESGQKKLGAALEEAVAQTLDAISAQAAVYALYYAALGTAALFLDPDAAADYFLAAGEMAAVAVVAGISGSLLGSGSSSSSTNGPSTGSVTGSSQAPVNPVGVQNVQRFGGGGLVTGRTLAMIGDSKNNAGQDATEAVLPLDDPEAMGAITDALGGTGGVHFHFEGGMISSDTLGGVMDQMSDMVRGGKKLVASHANRVVKKS